MLLVEEGSRPETQKLTRVAMRRVQTFEQEQEHRNVIADTFYWLG